jgi:hypothetical protein
MLSCSTNQGIDLRLFIGEGGHVLPLHYVDLLMAVNDCSTSHHITAKY